MASDELDEDLFDLDYQPNLEDDAFESERLGKRKRPATGPAEPKAKKTPKPKAGAKPSGKKDAAMSKAVVGMYTKRTPAVAQEVTPDQLHIPELEEVDEMDLIGDDMDDEDEDEKPGISLNDLLSGSNEGPLASSSGVTVKSEHEAERKSVHQPDLSVAPLPATSSTRLPVVSQPVKQEHVDTSTGVGPSSEASALGRKMDVKPVTAGYKGGPEAMAIDEDTTVPCVPATRGDETQMFWFDAREDTFGNAGTVYVFGKIFNEKLRKYQSCCVRVNGIMRCLFVLPRPEKVDEIADVVNELGQVMASRGISQRRMKAVYRWYAFEELGVPREKSRWVKVRYPASSPPLNITDCSQYRTFSKIFGDKRSFLELFLLKRKLKGPSWLSIRNAKPVEEGNKVSWCTFEYVVDTPKCVTPLSDSAAYPPVPLTVMSLNMITCLNEKLKVNEVAAVTCVVQDRISLDTAEDATKTRWDAKWTSIRRMGDMAFPFDLEKLFKSRNAPLPALEQTERSLLANLMNEIERRDPDVLVGHNFMGFDLDVLLHRLDVHKIGNWSRIGRMRLRQMPRLQGGAGGTGESTWEEKAVLHGRLVADTYLLAKEYLKETSYKLLSLAISQDLEGVSGKVSQEMIENEGFLDPAREMKTAEGIYTLVHSCDSKAVLQLKLLHKMCAIPLTRQLTALAGNLWSKTLAGARAERIEYLLLHKFHSQKYIVPDKLRTKFLTPAVEKSEDADNDEKPAAGKPGKAKAKYAGGKVLDPKRGLYTDYVLLLDFNSLYPSLIQEYNVCFTTVERPEMLADGSYPDAPVPSEEALVCEDCRHAAQRAAEAGPEAATSTSASPTQLVAGAGVPRAFQRGESCRHRCILPKAIRELVDKRRIVKKLLKEEKDAGNRAQLDIRQKALKLTANSIYGCLGFQSSRFYAQPIAQLITSKGREALTSTVELVPKVIPTLNVIYGDTDSVMISTGITNDVMQVIKTANLLKREVNKYYKHLEIDIDGIFKSILLVRKKKYASLKLQDLSKGDVESNIKREVKGLDLVRRDWCPLSQAISTAVLDEILSGRPSEEILDRIHAYLENMSNDIRNARVPLKEYVITKSLTKPPEQYPDAQNQPHVMVALRMKQQKLPVQTNDLIPYIICDPQTISNVEDNMKTKIACRAFHFDEVRASNTLKPDLEWYLGTQIHPPVTRLCEHIQGMDSMYIADALGIQSNNRYVTHHSSDATAVALPTYHCTSHALFADDEEWFKDAQPLIVACGKCGNPSVNLAVKKRVFDAVSAIFTESSRDEHAAHPINLFTCDQCGAPVPFAKVYNTVLVQIRKHQRRYYSQFQSISTHPPAATAPPIVETYPESEFRHQLTFYLNHFDAFKGKDQIHQKLVRKFLTPTGANQRTGAGYDSRSLLQQQRRLDAIFETTFGRSFCEEGAKPHPALRATDRAHALRQTDQLKSLLRLINKTKKACERYFIDLDQLFTALLTGGMIAGGEGVNDGDMAKDIDVDDE